MASLYKPIVFDGLNLRVFLARSTHIRATVHDARGQTSHPLWNFRRSSHRSLVPRTASPVAPSAVRTRFQAAHEAAFAECWECRARSSAQIKDTMGKCRYDAANAEAGYFDDGVDLYARNGYVIDHLLRSPSHIETDTDGCSAAERMRVFSAVVKSKPRRP